MKRRSSSVESGMGSLSFVRAPPGAIHTPLFLPHGSPPRSPIHLLSALPMVKVLGHYIHQNVTKDHVKLSGCKSEAQTSTPHHGSTNTALCRECLGWWLTRTGRACAPRPGRIHCSITASYGKLISTVNFKQIDM